MCVCVFLCCKSRFFGVISVCVYCFVLRCPPLLDETENYAELLTSDAATSCFSAADAEEAAATAEQLQEQLDLGKQCQQSIFARVGQLKKRKFQGSQVVFPELDSRFNPEDLLRRMPSGSTLLLDKFNGRWWASWKAPTGAYKRLSRSWGLRGHKQCITEIMDWVWGLAIGYGQTCPYKWPLQHGGALPSSSAGPATSSAGPASTSAGSAKPIKRVKKSAAKAK